MPSLGDASPQQWAQMYASTHPATYDLMETLRSGPRPRDQLSPQQAKTLADIAETGWVTEDDNGLVALTDAGKAHLKSF